MEFVILGFLMYRELSQYDLMKALKEEVSPFYKPSLGSLQTALKKLEKHGYISVDKVIDNGRNKHLYMISEAGKSYFRDYMLGEVHENKFKADTSTRLFFMGYMTISERLFMVDGIIDHLSDIIGKYEEGWVRYEGRKWSKDIEEIVHYQFKTLSLGIHNNKSNLSWFKGFRAELEALQRG